MWEPAIDKICEVVNIGAKQTTLVQDSQRIVANRSYAVCCNLEFPTKFATSIARFTVRGGAEALNNSVCSPVYQSSILTAMSTLESPALQDELGTSRNSVDVVREFVGELSTALTLAVEKIDDVNANTNLLALNARIEAARAGETGASFSVVAQEMQNLSKRTATIASEMAEETQSSIQNLLNVIDSSIRGSRLSDMALSNIDLVDRNLYERTCDVRWWATDSSLVDALSDSNDKGFAFASKRMGIILDAYTVYHDLVLADLNGNVVANGRPDEFSSQGKYVGDSDWFRQAKHSVSGDEYGFETAHRSKLVNDRSVLAYSCGVREEGNANGRLLGVLGILFNWEEFAQSIVNETPLSDSEKETTRCCICDDSGMLVADTAGEQLSEQLDSQLLGQVLGEGKNHAMMRHKGRNVCVAHARAPGFETYSTGWHSLIIQNL